MANGTFTIKRAKVKFRYLIYPEVFCYETQEWIPSDQEIKKQEMILNEKEQKKKILYNL